MKKIKHLLLVLMLTLSLATPATVPVIGTATPVSATARTSISNKSITLYKGKSKQLKIKGTSKKVKWSSKTDFTPWHSELCMALRYRKLLSQNSQLRTHES